ncbi:MAG: PQQ-binding-like beta-propeller repeat protein [Bacteroidetes bacterium]|nr:PQQ-binding-like beta-propeller repeat protein [Bacteroidota bacterium]
MEKFIVPFLCFFTLTLFAQDTQWRGENRDGYFHQEGLLKAWPEDGPTEILSFEGIGKGHSSVVVANNSIFATGMIDTLDYLTAFDMEGKQKWQVPYGRSWLNSFPDTRSTPTIEEDRIYLISGTGELVCLNSKTGEKNWSVDVDANFDAEWHRWGVAESPLIVGNKVICTPGGPTTTVVAFDKMTGEKIWQTESVGGKRSYVSPILYEYKGIPVILAMTTRHLLAVHPKDGKIAWKYLYHEWEWNESDDLILTNTPIFRDDEIFISKGYDYPSVMVKMNSDGTGVERKWMNQVLDNHHHGLVLVDGYIYGSNWENNRKGKWVCLDWNNGEVKYEEEWFNKGNIIYADGLLYCYEEKSGNVALVRPNPEKFDIISSFKIEKGSGPHWAHPTIYDGKLYIRHGDVIMVYDIQEG